MSDRQITAPATLPAPDAPAEVTGPAATLPNLGFSDGHLPDAQRLDRHLHDVHLPGRRVPELVAIKSIALRLLISGTTGLTMVFAHSRDWWRAAGVTPSGAAWPIPPLVVLLRFAGQTPAPADDLLRPVIRFCRQDPMHREATSGGGTPPGAQDASLPTPRQPGAARPASAPSGTAGHAVKPPRQPVPRTCAALAASAPVKSARHNLMHREQRTGPQPEALQPAPAPAPADPPPVQPAGPLRNGNPRGNPNLAPRCGARTRSGCPCRAPALRGKQRCRMHGGASTGPRSAEGLGRLRAVRTIHGAYAAETRARHRFLRLLLRRTALFVTAVALKPFLPPQAAARLNQRPPELSLVARAPGQAPPSRARERLLARDEAKAHAPWRHAIALAKAVRRQSPIAPEDLILLDTLFARLPPIACAASHRERQDPIHRESAAAARLRLQRQGGPEPASARGPEIANRLRPPITVSQIAE